MSGLETAAEFDRKMQRYQHLLPPFPPGLQSRMASQNPGGAEVDVAALQAPGPAAEAVSFPALSPDQVQDRALGCFLGLAAGDEVGAGTAAALCLAQSLLKSGTVDPADFMNRLLDWRDRGAELVAGRPIGIGQVTLTAIERFRADGNPAAGSEDGDSAGDGSLVRLAPLAIRWALDPAQARALARKQSRCTHAAQECVDACALFISQLADALNGAGKVAALRPRVMALPPNLLFISGGDWKEKLRGEITSSGYVVDTLEAALWAVWTTDNFRDAVLAAASLGDSVAACAGQLAGALYGASAIPAEWLAKLARRDRIEDLALRLLKARH